jgi:hypothetical protein
MKFQTNLPLKLYFKSREFFFFGFLVQPVIKVIQEYFGDLKNLLTINILVPSRYKGTKMEISCLQNIRLDVQPVSDIEILIETIDTSQGEYLTCI